MKLRKFNRVLRQVSLLPLLVLGITSAVLYLQILDANRTVALIQRSNERISQATLTTKLIIDEETGLRGFETTGDARFLEPYSEAQRQLDAAFQSLDKTSGSAPDATPLRGIDELRAAHTAWRDAFARPMIASVRAHADVADPERNMQGKVMMDAMRGELAGITRQAEERRAARIALWHEQVQRTEFVLFGLAIAAAVLVGLFARNRMHWVSDIYRASLQDLQQRADEIYESEQRLKTTLTSIGDGVITCDAEGCVQMMNAVAEDLTGWKQGQAHGKPLDAVFHIVNETTRQIVENPVAKVRRLNRIVGLANHTVLIRQNGTELQIADSGAPIRKDDGDILGFVMVFRDVTMERRTQEALIAQEKLAIAGRLAATIAHEINNPLSSVLDMLYLMRKGVSEEQSRRYMEMAEAELTRVGEIVRAMLGLYRESQAPIEVDLGRTLHDVLLLAERRFAELGVQVTTELSRDVCVMGFPAELRQVFTNLVSNAAEAAGSGGSVHISVAWADRDGSPGPGRHALVTIGDDGPGVEEHVLSQLFQPFFTTKGERGTGLGLWVSRGIVSKHNGTIDLKSSTRPESHGTTASVIFPVSVSAMRNATL